jgi:molecular chaperone DnaK (HSP70)
VLIARGAELPCGTSSQVFTDVDDQTSAEVQLLEGNSRDAEQCRKIARVKISGLPDELPRKAQINVLYQITSEGRLQVKAQLHKGGNSLAVEIERASGLTETEVGAWKNLLDTNPGLKAIHKQLAQHAARRPGPMPPPLPTPSAIASPPAEHDEQEEEDEEEATNFDLDVGASAGRRLLRNAHSSRGIMIMLVGHVVFAALGLAIGYYILMWLRPEWNTFDLPLPGLE